MNFFEKIINGLSARMTTPANYGWFHILCILLVIGACVLIGFFGRKASDKTVRIVVLCFAIVMLLFEVYKQLVFSYDGRTDTWDFQWYAFPFQFCSIPMYIALIAGCVKKGRVQNVLFSFLATYGVFAGLVVLLYPGDVFMSIIGINIQTMVHHGGMFVLGFFLLVSGRVKLQHKTILWASCVFCICVATALIMDIVFVKAGWVGTETFNMFFISPYFECTTPVLSIVYAKAPYIVFLITYVIGFTLAAYIMLLSAMGINKLIGFIKKKNIEKKEKKIAQE